MKTTTRPTGTTYVELIAAIAVLSVMFAVSTQLLALVMSRMTVLQRQRAATENASNVLEMITSRPFHEISDESLQDPVVRDFIHRALPDWDVDLNVTVEEVPVFAKRIEISLERAQSPTGVVKLTTWKHRLEAPP